MNERSIQLQLLLRICFTVGFLGMLLGVMFNVSEEEVITQAECMKDYTFIWTDSLNQYLQNHSNVKNAYIIFSSAILDIMFLTTLFLFFWKSHSFRLVLAYILFYGIRGVVQKIFLMNRLDGFIFGWPGFPSLTVPYWDTNDFFYSGHVGVCVLMALELKSNGYKRLSYACWVIMVNQAFMMCLVRAHYIIDLVSGALIAQYMFYHAEWLSFYVDAKIFHLLEGRGRDWQKPCKNCGWSNKCASDMICSEEKKRLKALKSQYDYAEKQLVEEESKSNQSHNNIEREIIEDNEVTRGTGNINKSASIPLIPPKYEEAKDF